MIEQIINLPILAQLFLALWAVVLLPGLSMAVDIIMYAIRGN